eukprot:8083081-Lingulodinium_polyedra.AAC.1
MLYVGVPDRSAAVWGLCGAPRRKGGKTGRQHRGRITWGKTPEATHRSQQHRPLICQSRGKRVSIELQSH